VAAHLLPGLVGILSRWSAAATALALVLAAALSGRSRSPARAERAPAAAGAGGTLSWILGAGSAGAVALWFLASAVNRTALPPDDVDTLTFHLPIVGKWIQSGSMWPVEQFTPLLAHGNYPQTGDVAVLAVVLPWRDDWLVGAVNPALIALAGLAVYAIARELGAARPHALLAAALLTSMPAVAGAANGSALTDPFMVATLAAGLLFLLRHERGAPRGELWLAGLALGLAFGTKWYAVTSVAVVIGVFVAARLLRRGAVRSLLRDGAALAGIVAVVGGIWMVRNAIESGSPLFPAEVAAFGLTIFDTPFDPLRACADFSVGHYLSDWSVLSDHVLPPLRQVLSWPGAVMGSGLLASGVLATRAPRRDRAAVIAGIALAVLLTVSYALTPTSAAGPEGRPSLVAANARYAVPAFLAAAPLLAWTLGRARRSRLPLELVGAAAVAEGVRRSLEVPLHAVALVALAIAAAAACGWAVLAATGRLGGRMRDRARLAALAAGAAGLVAAGHARQREFNADRYATGGGAERWIASNAPSGHRVAIAGVWRVDTRSPVWPAFGARLGNEVGYLGPTVDGQLREYSRRDAWAAALRRGHFDLLVVGRGGYSADCPVRGSRSDDDRWARAEGFEPVARSASLTLYRVPAAG
jgi:4-amino-4-deoxy-L-arabinose transferase-like glycosyltransferase